MNIRPGDVLKHNILGNVVDVTDVQGEWVEFLARVSYESGLRYLETHVFERYYTHVRNSPTLLECWDIANLRADARRQGILVPKEFDHV